MKVDRDGGFPFKVLNRPPDQEMRQAFNIHPKQEKMEVNSYRQREFDAGKFMRAHRLLRSNEITTQTEAFAVGKKNFE